MAAIPLWDMALAVYDGCYSFEEGGIEAYTRREAKDADAGARRRGQRQECLRESLVLKTGLPRYYLATMQSGMPSAPPGWKNTGKCGRKSSSKRWNARSTSTVWLCGRGTVLLEDLGNLVANELYSPGGAGKHTAEAVLAGLERLAAGCDNLIVVSNEVFSGGADYAGDTDQYLLALAQVNNAFAARRTTSAGGLRPAGVLQRGRKAVTVLQTIAVAFAMFSALPVPQFEWNEKKYAVRHVCLPLIGLVCGGLWCLCGVLPLPELARAAAFCLVPVAVTGGIHLDGYADTSDALSSYGDREKKLEILKTPTVGLRCHPAVLLLCGLLRPLRQCAVHTPGGPVLDAGAGAERALSGFAVAAFPRRKTPASPILLPQRPTSRPSAASSAVCRLCSSWR